MNILKKAISIFLSLLLIIFAIGVMRGTILIGDKKQELPSNNIQKDLIIETLNEFNLGLINKDFNKIYNNLSILFKDKYSLTEFNNLYITLLDEGVKGNNIKGYEEIIFLKNSIINSNNLLIIEGYYIDNYKFELNYIYEDLEWKLLHMIIYPIISEEK